MIIDSLYGFKWNVSLRGKVLSDEDKSLCDRFNTDGQMLIAIESQE